MSGLYKPAPDYDTKIVLHRGVAGNIVKWNSERGFGFVRVKELEDEIFFHANDLVAKSERAPQKNEAVTVYAKYDDVNKRWSATQVTSPQREQLAAERAAQEQALLRPMTHELRWAVPVAVIWLAAVAVYSWRLAGMYAVVSCVAAALYAWDKRCALRGGGRVPEMSLHTVAVLGGWAGALVARYLFRHKTQKQPFVAMFWTTVALNILITGYLLFSGLAN